jgi:hypothetical protein
MICVQIVAEVGIMPNDNIPKRPERLYKPIFPEAEIIEYYNPNIHAMNVARKKSMMEVTDDNVDNRGISTLMAANYPQENEIRKTITVNSYRQNKVSDTDYVRSIIAKNGDVNEEDVSKAM